MCSIDSQTTSSDCPSEPRFDEDPYGPIKISLEKTIQLLHLEESLVDNFLVKGHKKTCYPDEISSEAICSN